MTWLVSIIILLLISCTAKLRHFLKWLHIRAEVKKAQAALDSGDLSSVSEAVPLAEAAFIWKTSLQNESMPFTGLRQLTLSLAVSLWVRYKTHDEEEYLNLAISVGRHALSLQPPGRINRGMALGNLGVALYDKHELSDEPKLLSDAIDLLREATTLRPPGHSQRGDVLNNFCQALIKRYKQSDSSVDLIEVTEYARAAFGANPKFSPGHWVATRNMAIAQTEEFEAKNDISCLEQAIFLFEDTLHLSPLGHPDRAESLVNLASAYEKQSIYTGKTGKLGSAVDCAREAVQLRPFPHPKRYLALVVLGTCLLDHARSFTHQASLVESVTILEGALPFVPTDDDGCRFRVLSNLAVACEIKYKQNGDVTLLEEAIRLGEQALALPSQRTWQTNFSQIGLAQMLHTFYLHTNELAALESSIKLSEQALSFLREPSAQALRSKHAVLLNLSSALCSRFVRTRKSSELNSALGFAEEALTLSPSGHPQRATSLRALSNVLHEDFRFSGNKANAAKLVACAQEAAGLCPPSHRHYIPSLYTLSLSLIDSYIVSGDTMNIEEAIKHLQHIITIYPEGYANRCDVLKLLAGLYLGRDSSHFNPVVALEYALTAISDIHASLRQRLIIGRDILSFINQLNESHVMGIRLPTALGEMILKLYQQTIGLLPLVANYALDLPTRLNELADCESLATDAATFALRLNQPQLAIEMLENARGVFWAQALRLRDSEFDAVPSFLADELQALMRTLERDSIQVPGRLHTEELHDKALARRRQLCRRAEEIINTIRCLPQLERYLLGPTFDALSLAVNEGPIVILIANVAECNAIVLATTGNPVVVPLSALNLDDLRQMSLHTRETQTRGARADGTEINSLRLGMGISQPRRKKPIDHTELVLADIWYKIVKPIIGALKLRQSEHFDRPCVRWCPTGEFTFVPVHAAGVYSSIDKSDEIGSKYFVSSYTPTLSPLIRRVNISAEPLKLTTVRALLVAEPTPFGLEPLNNVHEEIRLVNGLLTHTARCTPENGTKTLEGAYVRQVKSEISGANILHLACHGLQHPTNPLQSGFYLRDGCLTVSDIMQLHITGPTFAFLSACETAKGDTNQPDQFIHLSAAILFAGFCSVVATMWTMGDADGPAVARVIYEELLQNNEIDLRRAPYALDKAVGMLRERLPPARWATFIHVGV